MHLSQPPVWMMITFTDCEDAQFGHVTAENNIQRAERFLRAFLICRISSIQMSNGKEKKNTSTHRDRAG